MVWLLVVLFALPAAWADGGGDDKQPQQPTPEQLEAKKKFAEGAELEKAGDYDQAIARYKEAFELFPDPGLWARIGQAYQLKGNKERDFDAYQAAVDAYKKYLELDANAEDKVVATINERIATLEKAIAEEKDRVEKQKEAERQQKIEEERQRREEEEKAHREKEAMQGMHPAIDALVVGGIDQDMSAVARLVGGGILGWDRFALEAHLVFEGFLRVDNTKGVSGRSLALDLGARYAFSGRHFRGLFLDAGGSFGLYGGRPRERKLADNPDTCMGFDTPENPGTCSFDIDKNITARFGVGYGFAASKTTTVAVRLDGTFWLFSVDDSQSPGAVPASLVDKPQSSASVLLGLQFMRWFGP